MVIFRTTSWCPACCGIAASVKNWLWTATQLTLSMPVRYSVGGGGWGEPRSRPAQLKNPPDEKRPAPASSVFRPLYQSTPTEGGFLSSGRSEEHTSELQSLRHL